MPRTAGHWCFSDGSGGLFQLVISSRMMLCCLGPSAVEERRILFLSQVAENVDSSLRRSMNWRIVNGETSGTESEPNSGIALGVI